MSVAHFVSLEKHPTNAYNENCNMRKKLQLTIIVLAALSLTIFSTSYRASAQKPIDFNREIRPILSDNCFSCHGPDDQQRKAKLRFDTKEGAFAKTGVIIAGDANNSRLMKRITSTNPDTVMPPPESGHKLTPLQIDSFKRWIEEGAKWNEHWAFTAPKKNDPPTVQNSAWVRNPIDNFILARLEKENLKPSPEADKTTLIRRLSYDLTGLPPTTEEVDNFLSDNSPNAYEKVVDRLLASPRYGERFAMYWMDIARYADTHGFHIDSQREMYPWRDWVIKSFNENKPYNQFIVEQLAGDLLPNATLDQKIGSGFNRNHMINFEGGAIPEEYQTEYVIDRVETTSNAFMALTMGCARCHTHKYDPISHKEFYQFAAFFNSVPEVGLDGRDGNAKPFLALPTSEQKSIQDRLTATIKAKEKLLDEKVIAPDQTAWEKQFVGKIAEAPREGLIAHYEFDGSLSDVSGHYLHARRLQGNPDFQAGKIGRGASFDGDTQVTFGNIIAKENSAPFTITGWYRANKNLPITLFQKLDNPERRQGFEVTLDGWQLVGIQRRAAKMTIRFAANKDSAIEVKTRTVVNVVDRGLVTISYDGSGKAAGVKVFLDEKPMELEIIKDNLAGSFGNEADFQIGNKKFGRPFNGVIDDLRFYNRVLSNKEIEQLATHYPIQTYLSGVYGQLSKDEKESVRNYFLTYSSPENLKAEYTALNQLKKEKTALEKQIVTTMVMSEMEKPRDTFILGRGDYRNKTEKVTPGVLAVLPAINSKNKIPNRLDLAKWLVEPSHPLTARVAVNRFWQLFFGLGIVKTSEDFGSQGEPPVHAELLDWLAVSFRDGNADLGLGIAESKAAPQSAILNPKLNAWDTKALHRLIVTSATYRQTSKTNSELKEKDPENRLLARGSRYRLQGEVIRDTALTASGLMNPEIGGKSVFPYQPPGLWEEMAFGDGFTAQTYVPSKGKDLYRRSMYSFWKRTVPPAAMSTFDAPDREKCVVRRPVTNTPLQALITMNDPTYIEAARVLATKALMQGKDFNARIIFAFRKATARQPSVQEVNLLRDLLSQQMTNFTKNRQAAEQLIKVGETPNDGKIDASELAAWTMVVSAILNLDEVVTRE